ncbi:unnamed protein product [Rhizoctonia solani]|uniref:DUF6532 domain-containing protein n=1 Tax=Rhizoctonia solani TaxID=456999 RepID=A0A8H3GBU0_9AGAM|nr:unnamed protein product [Rhizoctonia solani]
MPAPTVEASVGIAGAFDGEELQDMGTVEADDVGSTGGTKIRKAPFKGGTHLAFRSQSQVPSVSTAPSACSSSPELSRASTPLITPSRISSQRPLTLVGKHATTPVVPNTHRSSSLKAHVQSSSANTATNKPQGAWSASSHIVQSNLTDVIKWDIDSEEEEAECNRIEQDDTAYVLGETSCDEDRPKKKGKAKSSDYQGPVRAILEATLDKVFANLLAQGFFIEAKELDELIARTWRFCAIRIVNNPTLNRYSISLNKLRAIKYRITTWQGKLKDAIKPKVAGAYGLTGTADKVKAAVDELLDHEFHRRPGSEPGTGYYQHPLLQIAFDATVFSKRKGKPPIGAKFSKMFVKMPLPTIALLCAIIHFLLETSRSDDSEEECDDSIIREMLEEYYEDHLQSLLNLAKVDPKTVGRIQTRMYQRGIKRVPVKPATAAKSESNAGRRVLSIKDIVRSEPKPSMDREDDAESESKSAEGSGSGSGEEGNAHEAEGGDEQREDEDEEGGDEGQDREDEREGGAKGGRRNREAEEKEAGKGKGKGKGSASGSKSGRPPVDDEGVSCESAGEDAGKGKGKLVRRAKKLAALPSPATPVKSRLRPKLKPPPTTSDTPESGTGENMHKSKGDGGEEVNQVGMKGAGLNGGKRKARVSTDGALAAPPNKRGKRPVTTGV